MAHYKFCDDDDYYYLINNQKVTMLQKYLSRVKAIITADRVPDLCAVAEAADSDSSSSIVDAQFLNHINDEAKHVRLEIIVVHVTGGVNQKQYVSLLPARSSAFKVVLTYQTYRTFLSKFAICQHFFVYCTVTVLHCLRKH